MREIVIKCPEFYSRYVACCDPTIQIPVNYIAGATMIMLKDDSVKILI